MDRLALLAVLVATLGLGTAYAARTPAWQAPDEPAHYNYIASLAADPLALPRIEPGAYSQARIAELADHGFAAGAPIDDLQYEDYQPPLYYYLALPAYALGGPTVPGRLFAVRWLGAFLGVLAVAVTWRIVLAAAPGSTLLAAGCAAFVGFLPMRLATASSANNDALAHLVAAVAMLAALSNATAAWSHRRFVLVGSLIGAAAIATKATVYPSLAVMAVSELLRQGPAHGPLGRLRSAMPGIAASLALPAATALAWFARNASVYGSLDILGTRAHDRIVTGQPRTAEWIDQYGLQPWLERLLTFTFQSFWGVFGWLGVFLDQRLYALLLATTLAAAAAVIAYLPDLWRGARRRAGALLALQVCLAALVFLLYNVRYVQHQGRYLLVALPALGLAHTVGLRQLGRALCAATGGRLERRAAERAAVYGFSVALGLLAHVALQRYVVPALSGPAPGR